MPEFIVTVSDDELKALKSNVYDFQIWIQNAASEKARRVINRLVEEHTNLNYKKISKEEKEAVVHDLTLETAKERGNRMKAESEAQ